MGEGHRSHESPVINQENVVKACPQVNLVGSGCFVLFCFVLFCFVLFCFWLVGWLVVFFFPLHNDSSFYQVDIKLASTPNIPTRP
jgi:hypothetical protein